MHTAVCSYVHTVAIQSTYEDIINKHTVFRIVRKKTESPRVVVAVIYGVIIVGHVVVVKGRNRGIEIAGVENNQHIVDQIIDIHPNPALRIHASVGFFAQQGQIGFVGGKAFGTFIPQSCPGFQVAVGGFVRIGPEFGIDFDDVVVVFMSAEIMLGIVGFGPFVGLVEPPVHAVEVEMVIASSFVGLFHAALQVATENIGYHGIVFTAVFAPGVILFAAQVHAVEFFYSLVIEKGVFQLGGSVFFSEEETKSPFDALFLFSTGGSPDANTRVYLKAFGFAGVDQFYGTGTFPGPAAFFGVHIDTAAGIEQMLHVGYYADAGDLPKGCVNVGRIIFVVYHGRIHFVVEPLSVVPTDRPFPAGVSLGFYLIGKNIGSGNGNRRLITLFHEAGAQNISRRLPSQNGLCGVDEPFSPRAGIDGGRRSGGFAAVEAEQYVAVGIGRFEGQSEGFVVKSGLMTDLYVAAVRESGQCGFCRHSQIEMYVGTMGRHIQHHNGQAVVAFDQRDIHRVEYEALVSTRIVILQCERVVRYCLGDVLFQYNLPVDGNNKTVVVVDAKMELFQFVYILGPESAAQVKTGIIVLHVAQYSATAAFTVAERSRAGAPLAVVVVPAE
ncbi:MAG: hypothetical protein BWX77_00358 [Bacteroidetes bacterium ADurb.Bin090]|nr:MAG: hypothetical protein BWX77_00358 [Bacteroidetes bacterium ADurb.Bin090]